MSGGSASNTYAYDMYSNLSSITHNGFSYNYTYDNFNNLTSVSVGTNSLVTYTYDASKERLARVTYGNGDYVDCGYDAFLKHTYGDYMSLPPENERISHHFVEEIFLDDFLNEYKRPE